MIRTFARRAGELTALGDDTFFLSIDELLEVLSSDSVVTATISARQETHLARRMTMEELARYADSLRSSSLQAIPAVYRNGKISSP